MPKQRLVVIGNGMAGARVVEEVLAQGGADRFKIAVFSDEASGSYDRMQLADVMNGSQAESEIVQRSFDWYRENQIQLNGGQRAVLVSRPTRTVYGSAGVAEHYDKLVFATGSSPYFPPLENLFDVNGARLAGVSGFRTLDDCRTIAALAGESRRVAVIGGGLLALEAARGLTGNGREVHMIHSGSQLMNQHLDEYAGQIVQRLVERAGIRVHLNQTVRSLTGQRRVSGLVPSDGTRMDCELVVVSAGLIPNTWLAYQCGLTVERGIAVDAQLRSLDDRDIYALGECAQLRDRIHGSKDAIVEQARIVAAQLLDDHSSARYRGHGGVRMKVMGMNVASIGNIRATADRDQITEYCDPGQNQYRKVVLRDRRLVGAILLGEISAFSALSEAFESNARLSDDELAELIVPTMSKTSGWAQVA
ncbi:MAG TPA: FAD-dependent oxidoreductase [Polyangiaceae bacterium]|nr:FAD-dependent oxidoreductase [Polyangiaceae bacterium]